MNRVLCRDCEKRPAGDDGRCDPCRARDLAAQLAEETLRVLLAGLGGCDVQALTREADEAGFLK